MSLNKLVREMLLAVTLVLAAVSSASAACDMKNGAVVLLKCNESESTFVATLYWQKHQAAMAMIWREQAAQYKLLADLAHDKKISDQDAIAYSNQMRDQRAG